MTDLIARMKAEIATMEAAPPTAPLSSSVPSGMNGIPTVSDITLITYNLFDNGASHETKWSSSRFAVSLQVFTLTTPFTPSPSLAAWTGTVQLLDPEFWHNYITFKHEEGKIDQVTFDRLTEMYRATYQDANKSDASIGTFVDKSHGTAYSWLYFVRFWTNPFGEPVLELSLDEVMPHIDVWETVKQVPGKNLPILRARYNPHGLWVAKRPKGKKA